MNTKLNKDKYFKILQADGLHEALTHLHKDMEALEQICFEGEDGWRPDIWNELKTYRNFSQELWNFRVISEQSDATHLQPQKNSKNSIEDRAS